MGPRAGAAHRLRGSRADFLTLDGRREAGVPVWCLPRDISLPIFGSLDLWVAVGPRARGPQGRRARGPRAEGRGLLGCSVDCSLFVFRLLLHNAVSRWLNASNLNLIFDFVFRQNKESPKYKIQSTREETAAEEERVMQQRRIPGEFKAGFILARKRVWSCGVANASIGLPFFALCSD